MLKTIDINQVRLGMFINQINGSWLEHPFWRKKFILNNEEDLAKLISSNVPSLVIDTSLGNDVLLESDNLTVSIIETKPSISQPISPVLPIARVKIEDEHGNALEIIKSSKNVVASMFKDIRLGKAVQPEMALSLVDEISQSLSRNSQALISLVRLKSVDDYTYMHSVAVCALMTALARELKMSESEVKVAGLAGLLHDMGKAGISPTVLNKPGKLSDSEFDLVKKHPEIGHELLTKTEFIHPVVLDVCLHHHEKVDGNGYPHKLTSDQISPFAKMGAICDVYDAVTSDRAYKAAWSPSQSLKKMSSWDGHFDPEIFKAFINSVGIFPVGTIVILKSNRLGVVVDQTPDNLLRPLIKVFFSIKSKMFLPVTVLDLSIYDLDEIVGHTTTSAWGIKDVDYLWANT